MEVTLLVHAADQSFRLIEGARKQAIELLDSAVSLTAETRSIEKEKIREFFRGAQEEKAELQNFISTSLILYGFWVLLSGHFDTFHLTLGVICSLLVAHLSHDLLFANVRVGDIRLVIIRFILYIPWLICQIVSSNIHVALLALNPKMPIEPQILQFSTKLESDISWVVLANSITLTPGTITMDIKEGEFYVHALDKKVAEDLKAGEMEDRVAHVFMEADHIYVQDVLDVARIYGALRKS
jgi:multicomponent Na+:H+ antiporter subunit E